MGEQDRRTGEDVARKKNKKKSVPRRVVGVALLLLLAYLIYFIVGMSAPFLPLAKTAPGTRDPASYRGNGAPWVERAAVIEENGDAFDWRLKLIDAATETVSFVTYQFREGESTTKLAAALKDAAERGVRVRIIVDGFNDVLRMEGKTFFRAMAAVPGIEIKIYNRPSLLTPWNCNARLHDKYFIVDDLAYIIGGRNTHDGFLLESDNGLRNYDREALIYNTAHGTEPDPGNPASIYGLIDYFDEMWESDEVAFFRDGGAKPTDKKTVAEYARWEANSADLPTMPDPDSALTEATLAVDCVTLLTGETGTRGKKPLIWNELVSLCASAKDRVLIQTPYILFSRDMYRDVETIVASGAKVSMLTNSILNTDNRFAPLDYLYHQDEILDTGVSIYEFDGAYSTHAKTILIDDDLVVIGSFNVDLRSTYMNTEIVAVIAGEEFQGRTEDCMRPVFAGSVEIGEGNTVGKRLKEDAGFFKRVALYFFGAVVQLFRFEL
ncbi:MAG: phospholipase D family protein [Clostridia bacterium]|nr:phospholipase D family protein [Clostridia bacterium]MBR5043760.1 phospholipase D family protein [Clostridia bacterium]